MAEVTEAILIVFSVSGLLAAAIGFACGIVGGAIPGIGAPLVLTLMIPFTLLTSPGPALIALISAYAGAMYSGSIPAIVMNTPGTPSCAAAAFDGYPMTKQGRGITAICISATASAIGCLIGALALAAAAPLLIQFLLAFGSAEFFLLGILGFTAIVSATKGSRLKGFIAAAFGALIATVGATPLNPMPRFTGDILELYGGVNLIAAFIGVFAIAEMMRLAGRPGSIVSRDALRGSRREGIALTFRERQTLLRSGGIGLFVGVIPGEGGTVATFLAYSSAQNTHKERVQIGKGHPAGIVAAETANNSVVAGALLPTLAFGLPGSGTTAVLLGGLLLQGLQPGPAMFGADIAITYSLIGALILCAVLTMLVGVGLARQSALVSTIPNVILVPTVAVVSLIAAYAIEQNYVHVIQALLLGILGYGIIRYNYPIIAFVIGLVLGPLTELNFARVLQLAGNDLSGTLPIFLQRPISLVIIGLTVLLLIAPLLPKRRTAKPRSVEAERIRSGGPDE